MKGIIYRILSLLMGIFQRLKSEINDTVDFLKISYPDNECVLVRCRAETSDSYDCCANTYSLFYKKNKVKTVSKKQKTIVYIN